LYAGPPSERRIRACTLLSHTQISVSRMVLHICSTPGMRSWPVAGWGHGAVGPSSRISAHIVQTICPSRLRGSLWRQGGAASDSEAGVVEGTPWRRLLILLTASLSLAPLAGLAGGTLNWCISASRSSLR